ncbi:TorF family putative porin [Prolixibacteraceae bacterium Z1-6]|uniref:TorF family putative porin n=1 Tax=Draconibacterium aestuarii TaxID=2998507 RepID=A0A9X3FDB3_9BACT|nr:TorF family putative porin [Prolixibacteraceae bacterium Z1-6]
MKKTLLIAASMLLLFSLTVPQVKAQEWSTGLDIYSSYLWRGAKFGTGPAFQPGVEFSAGGFAIGAWGSYSAGDVEAAEADLYMGYGFDLGENASLSFTLTDYYFPGSSWTESESHYFEPMVSLGVGAFTFTAAYMEGLGDDEINSTSDLYLEAAVSAGPVDITLGGGDGQYTDDGDFTICNIMVGTSKEIAITETFTLPVSGAVMLNPSTGGFHIAVGISL